jgi:rod shape-determining protein MreC
MQQIFNFLFKNSILLLFLLLLGVSLTLTIQSHSYHRSQAVSSANAISGYVYEQVNTVEEYLSLKEQNEALAGENARLKKLLFNTQDTANIPPVKLPEVMGNFGVIQSKVKETPLLPVQSRQFSLKTFLSELLTRYTETKKPTILH